MALKNNITVKRLILRLKWFIITKPFYPIMMKLLSPLILLILNRAKFSKKELNKINNIYEAVDFIMNFEYFTFSIRASQIRNEIIKLLEILKDIRPKVILEIGTLQGGTLFLFTRIANPEATLISLDLPGGPYGGGYAEWKKPLFQFFAKSKQKIELVNADSHDPKTLELIRNVLNGRRVDFLFIDGDHTYEGIKRDFEMYSSLVKEGGIIAFHDIAKYPHETTCDVNKFWNEIKKDYEFLEIIEDINQNWAGIGVIYL